MRWLNRLKLRVRSLVQRQELESELQQELDFHLAEQKAEYQSRGMSAAEAELAARRCFGNCSLLAEECRDQRGTQSFDCLAGDLNIAVRTLWRSPGFTLASTLTLALGVGANLIFFSTAYGVLFRPLPYPDPARIVEIDLGIGGVGPTTALRNLAVQADYAGYLPKVETTAQLGGEAVRVQSANATWNLARVLGVQPALGRWFEAREENAGQHRVVVLSDRMWRERFDASRNLLGRQILLNEEPYEIVGVMPPQFAFPTPGTELWTPIRIDPASPASMWGNLNLWPIGRLKPNATLQSAQAELRPILNRIRPLFPWRMPEAWGVSSTLVLHSQLLVKDARPKLLALAGASLLLLLIACANVSNLLLTRWILRSREFAVREALGAGRGRLLRQVITENLVLATFGGAAGVLVAWGLLRFLPLLLGDIPRLHELRIVPNAAIGAVATMLGTFAILSVVPMLRSKILGGQVVSGGRSSAGRSSTRISLALAGLQLAMATALLIGAGLMGRTLWQLANVDSGLHTTQVLTASVAAGPSRCSTAERCWSFLQDVSATLAAVPGVRSVNWSNGIPLTRQISAMSVDIEDHPKEAGAPAFVLWHSTATPGYFGALGIPLRAGRLFADADRAATLPVAIISEATARRFWPKESPLGKIIRPVSGKVGRRVVGVVGDVAQYSLDGFPSWIDGVQYVPFEQALPRSSGVVPVPLLIEAVSVPTAALQSAIRQRFPDVVVSGFVSIGAVREASVSHRRSTAWLLSFVAGLGLLLGVVGVHGVLTQRATQRTREMGVRMALGATAGEIAFVVLREALLVGVAGAALGAVVAFELSRFLRALLFGIAESDVMTYVGGPAVLIATALLAAAIPAIRAARMDPVKILRAE
ncbi:ADOP family duplicated permease [Bryobacter aggregatus]|uniref:ADOP family duplicated permease n=1 Tax=Bryobacter aggregatus TaxID=360054 RepID=UPI0004E0D379|nr:ADOP family duplicated permease [Bryobacter aggregatus]